MGKIFYVMGKSASGKDTIYKELLKKQARLQPLIPYTTRPMRAGERDGEEYRFVVPEVLERFAAEGKVIERRDYQTAQGIWSYATVDDGEMAFFENISYLGIGTLESFARLRNYYGAEKLVPLYIEVESGCRLERALRREKQQKEPQYAELCRRFLADEEDFSEARLAAAGIGKRYQNDSLKRCLAEITEDVIIYA
ncbi:MAG: guanylate kinase [Stomatobaculum sp.]